MDSIDLSRLERRARRKYEWARARRAVLGFAPALGLVTLAALSNKHPTSALCFGGAMFVVGVGSLVWMLLLGAVMAAEHSPPGSAFEP